MQLRKNSSTFSNISSKNITDQQLIEKALQNQLTNQFDLNCYLAKKNNQVLPSADLRKSKANKLFKIELIQQEEQKKLKFKSNNHHLLNYFPIYTTLMDSEFFSQNNFTATIYDKRDSIQTIKSPYQKEKLSYERKKLIPIKKPKNQQKQQKKSVHATFLSVQKAPVMYQQLNSFDKNSMTITTSSFNKNKFLITRKSFQSSQASQLLQNPQKSIFSKQQLIKIARNKPFVPSFGRYHYFDFLWKVSFSNGVKIQFPEAVPKKYKAFIGRGNNSNLIKTLLKRRQAWWTFTDKIDEANFVWTQIKVNNIFNNQVDCSPAPFGQQPENVVSLKSPIYRKNIKIMSEKMTEAWIKYFHEHRDIQQKLTPNFVRRNRLLAKGVLGLGQLQKIKVHNHIPRNYVLGNKKALFATMKKYYEACNKNVFEYLPLTFHIQKGTEDPQYFTFLKYYHTKQKQIKASHIRNRNIWIVKPGELTNRGNGITVCHSFQQIKSILRNKIKLDNGSDRTYIVQEYLQRPFLYCGRKFDIRHYMLITFVNGHIKGYWCELGYIRTTSYQYSLNNAFSSVHLTNDAVQKMLPDYGKYQRGNKLSYAEFENYLQVEYSGKFSFFKTIYPQMKNIAYDCMKASALLLDSDRKGHNFEIFGFDFMIDSKFHPWLIQINTNPCLELSCPVLLDVIPHMVENALKIGLDSIFPPPQSFQQKRARFSNNVLQQNYFQLLFDSTIQQKNLREIMHIGTQSPLNFKQLQKDQEEVYEDDGILLDD